MPDSTSVGRRDSCGDDTNKRPKGQRVRVDSEFSSEVKAMVSRLMETDGHRDLAALAEALLKAEWRRRHPRSGTVILRAPDGKAILRAS